MRRLITLTITMLALTSFMAINSLAQNPHFIFCSANGGPTPPDGTLTVSFKISGLGANETITITLSATASGADGCLNNGGNCPSAANKFGPVPASATGTFTSGKNGQITGALSLSSPVTLSCPKGQTSVLVNITYTGVTVTAPPAGKCDIPGTFAGNFFPNCVVPGA